MGVWFVQLVHELSTGNQWSFDVQWCPRNPALVSSCSFDGHVSVFSLMGGAPPTQTSNKVLQQCRLLADENTLRVLAAFSAFCWLGGRKGTQPVENCSSGVQGVGMVVCLERDADLHMFQLMPLPLTVSCFSKIQIGFTFLASARPGSPGQRAVKRVCVCACVRVRACVCACLCVRACSCIAITIR